MAQYPNRQDEPDSDIAPLRSASPKWRTPKTLEQRLIALGFLGATVLLAFLFAMVYRTNSKFVQWNGLVAHTREVLGKLDAFGVAVKNSQIAAVDFYTNGSEQQVKVFEASESDARKALADLRSLTADNQAQAHNLALLTPVADQALALLAEVIQLRRDGKSGPDGLKTVTEEARKISPPLAKALADMTAEENHLLEIRSEEATIAATRARRLQVGGGIAAITLLILICLLFLRENSIRGNAESQLEKMNLSLEHRIAGRTEELERALLVVRKQNEEPFRLFISSVRDYAILVLDPHGNVSSWNVGAERIKGYRTEEIVGQNISTFYTPEDVASGKPMRALKIAAEQGKFEDAGWRVRKDGTRFWANVTLTALRNEAGELHGFGKVTRDMTEQKRVEEEIKTQNTQLEASNKELEAFCYSVSHDLRAPLRGIDGFSQAVLQDCADQLSAQGKAHLERVRAAALRMGALIDDLLNLSRITRSEMRSESIDLTKLAKSIAGDLRAADPDRNAEFVIAAELDAKGDPRLIQVALQNLMANSWKFTSKRPDARIEVGRCGSNGKSAFFVADNGAGFDPAYADRLFGAFQRLHTVSEFPGTGVGLATVQRIIHRHGGEIWAKSEVDHGATFYFTL